MDEAETIREAQRLLKRWDNLRIVGSRGEWSGNARQGFMFNPQRGGGSAGGGVIPPPPHSGACCHEGDCTILTPEQCAEIGGDYQGDDTTCDPNPCPPTGACCVGSNCIITTEDDCTEIGGDYQGDGTTCDPNPCLLPCNGCGFDAFDGSGRVFLTKTTVRHYTQTSECCEPFSGCAQCAVDGTQTTTESYDSDCNYSSVTDPVSPLFPTSGGCHDSCDGGFINITLAPGCDTLTTISATEKSCTYGTTFSCETCSNEEGGTDTVLTVTVILSDECNPV